MEGWRQRRPGSNARNPQERKRKQKRKTLLTHTGLLMEGMWRSVGFPRATAMVLARIYREEDA
jgi:hypothetical protein